MHRTSRRGRLATVLTRCAIAALRRRTPVDVRSPTLDWAAARRMIAASDRRFARLARGVRREIADTAPVPAEWFVPPGSRTDDPETAGVLYVHGGSFCLDRTALHDALASHLARATGLPVLAVDYRLAPEHPYPAAIDDVLTTWRWLRSGRPADRLAILGDSAGAGLALSALLRLRDEGADRPAAFVGLCPWADLTFSGASIIDNADTDVFMSDIELVSAFTELYLQGTPAATASPALADLHGLPDTLVHAGSHDMLADDARRIVDGVRRGGGRARLELWTHLPHVWQRLGNLVPEARQSIEGVGSFLSARFAATRPVP